MLRTTASVFLLMLISATAVRSQDLTYKVEQLTQGKQHHLFGYIGQCKTIPWNASGRYIVAMRSKFHDHLPKADEAADIILIDTQNGNKIEAIEKTLGWNLQQGTMLYWNPAQAETQFFFNDRDPKTNKIFTVLYDIEKRKRVREYRFDDVSIANGGVAQNGGHFIAINYGRMARLRPVTGYPEAHDWNAETLAPMDDGIFRVDVQTGEKQLLVSFHQLKKLVAAKYAKIDQAGLYINHTLCNRVADRIYFFVRGRVGSKSMYVNTPCTIKPDGSDLSVQQFIGGHPEWGEGNLMFGSRDDKQVVYDVVKKKVVGDLGGRERFPNPEGDISLSPDGRWFANGYSNGDKIRYVVLDRNTGKHVRTTEFSRGPYRKGPLRIDPAPRWNRTNDALLVPGFTDQGTRQMFVIRIESK